MEIRPAQNSDIPAIREIYNHSIENTTSVYSYEGFSEERMERWYLDKVESDLPVMVSVEDGVITGYATYGPFRNWPAYKFTVEHSIHIHVDYRRKGLAKQLLIALIDHAKRNGLHAMIGGIDADNDGSISLHESLGFKVVGHLPQVGYKFDRWLDLKFLQLLF
jgi:L-amino acid N-acyltransferase YncA